MFEPDRKEGQAGLVNFDAFFI